MNKQIKLSALLVTAFISFGCSTSVGGIQTPVNETRAGNPNNFELQAVPPKGQPAPVSSPQNVAGKVQGSPPPVTGPKPPAGPTEGTIKPKGPCQPPPPCMGQPPQEGEETEEEEKVPPPPCMQSNPENSGQAFAVKAAEEGSGEIKPCLPPPCKKPAAPVLTEVPV
jgi:hypothetical protein